ncbi:hypothetical protein M011DRAFT_464696 [Sporormia fimetaria CBS 119925]|uniref:Rhodopsin domain-containing protein n=1 Tax=Sporormia fimetaria CBS 119925 TaxID=1340428 RepID=A0A6A6VM54_9PLEO|nr:hypothetical protein M011DRAFT_464696 [Sporormia fimetaria CBS 119925]
MTTIPKDRPISALLPDNQGSWNTITAIFLIVASVIIIVARYVIANQRRVDIGKDDAIYTVGWVVAITMSVVSQQMVPLGLGQHTEALTAEKLNTFYRMHYATHFLSILSMTCSKTSIIVLFMRLMPNQQPLITKTLLPFTLVGGAVSMFLVGFQCQMPEPWVLEPLNCSTRGNVHYATVALNILTDVILAVWVTRPIWSLQMPKGTAVVVISLLAARVIVCIADAAKIAIIRRALKSQDTTWVFLPWAVMDQVVVHLSLNHASLPRVHTFLRNLQTGMAVSRVTGGGGDMSKVGTAQPSGSRRPLQVVETGRSGRSGFFNALRSQPAHSVSENQDAHSSETHLRLEPEHGTEMSTFVTVGDNDSTSSNSNTRWDEKGVVENRWDIQGPEQARVPPGHIKVLKSVEVRSERGSQ